MPSLFTSYKAKQSKTFWFQVATTLTIRCVLFCLESRLYQACVCVAQSTATEFAACLHCCASFWSLSETQDFLKKQSKLAAEDNTNKNLA
jgi:hypothetical protein